MMQKITIIGKFNLDEFDDDETLIDRLVKLLEDNFDCELACVGRMPVEDVEFTLE